MRRIIITCLTTFALSSCDCRKGPTGPAAYVKNLVEDSGSRIEDQILLKRFQSGLEHLSIWELGKALEPLQDVYRDPENITDPVKHATDLVIQEVLSRNPDWIDIHRFLGDDYFGGPKSWFLFRALAKDTPVKGWSAISAYYRNIFQYNQIMTREHATSFFSSLKKHHPIYARDCLKELIDEFSYETAELRIGATEAFLTTMTKSSEVISFIAWLRVEKLEQCPVGFLGLDHDYLKITLNDIELGRIITNALLILTKVSPTDAETWIIENKKSNSLPKAWGTAYVIGSYRNDPKSVESAYRFVAQNSKPNDGTLESVFSFYYFKPSAETLGNLRKIQAEANR